MQCKDIPTQPILDFLSGHNGKWCTWFDDRGRMPTVKDCMPPNTPAKLRLAKMRSLIGKGIIEGCACGCCGDFRLAKDTPND